MPLLYTVPIWNPCARSQLTTASISCGAGPNSIAEFLRGKPLVKAGRIRVVQPIDELFQRLLPRGAALELKLDVSHEEIVRHGALVELRTRRNMRIAGEPDEFALVDRLRGGGRGAGKRRGQSGGDGARGVPPRTRITHGVWRARNPPKISVTRTYLEPL
jgi:hypothetical protein